AALVERGAERHGLPFRAAPARDQSAGDIDRRPFERAATDGACNRSITGDGHARPCLARRRALRFGNGDQRGRAVEFDPVVDGAPRLHHRPLTACTALRMASGVAGASSGTCEPGASEWTASAIAANTEIASISGGSPTAFERQIVSSRFSLSKNATRKSSGTS